MLAGQPPTDSEAIELVPAYANQAEEQVRNGVVDYYAVLGVSPDASEATIGLAYRRQAARWTAWSWWPGAQYKLKLLNAAYLVLGHPARRADYHRQRGLSLPRTLPAVAYTRPSRGRDRARAHHHGHRIAKVGGGQLEGLALAVVALAALGLGAVLMRQEKLIDLQTPVLETARNVGLVSKPRTVDAEQESASALATALPAVEPTATAQPTAVPIERQFDGTRVSVQPTDPRVGTNITVTARIVRDGQPVVGLPVYLVAHFRTVDERWPAGSATVRTDERGEARIPFNIGAATVGHTVRVDVFATVEDRALSWSSAFTPQ
jgi:hypothetical protein